MAPPGVLSANICPDSPTTFPSAARPQGDKHFGSVVAHAIFAHELGLTVRAVSPAWDEHTKKIHPNGGGGQARWRSRWADWTPPHAAPLVLGLSHIK